MLASARNVPSRSVWCSPPSTTARGGSLGRRTSGDAFCRGHRGSRSKIEGSGIRQPAEGQKAPRPRRVGSRRGPSGRLRPSSAVGATPRRGPDMSSPDRPRESSPGQALRRTMPPPELLERSAPASVARWCSSTSAPRHPCPGTTARGPRRPTLRGRLVEARAAGDADAEREAAVSLARLLASRGRDLAVATKLAMRALADRRGPHAPRRARGVARRAGRDGGGGRIAAGAGLPGQADRGGAHHGEDRGAPGALGRRGRRGRGARRGRLARPGRGDGRRALRHALGLGARDGDARRRRRRLPRGGAAARRGRRRRGLVRGRAARAFEVAPHHPAAAEAVARALAGAGSPRRRRGDAPARSPPGRRTRPRPSAAHRRRMLAALKDGDAARAVGAMLDGGLEGEIEGDFAVQVDEVISLAGLYELLAVRLEARAERLAGPARSETYQGAGQALRRAPGQPGSGHRGLDRGADQRPRELGGAQRPSAITPPPCTTPPPLAEALIRVAPRGRSRSRRGRSRPRRLGGRPTPGTGAGPPPCASWQRSPTTRWATPRWRAGRLDALAAAGHEGDLVNAEKLGLLSRLRRQEDELAAARRAYEGASLPEARLKALRRILAVYQGRPGELREYVNTAAELARALPRGAGADPLAGARGAALGVTPAPSRRCSAIGSTSRRSTTAAPPPNLRLDGGSATKPPRVELVRARLLLSAIARRRGDEARALEEVLPVLTEAPGQPWGRPARRWSWRRGPAARRARADALVQIAGPAWPALRGRALRRRRPSSSPLGSRRATPQAPSCRGARRSRRARPTPPAPAPWRRSRPSPRPVEDGSPPPPSERANDHGGAARRVWCGAAGPLVRQARRAGLSFAWTQRWLALCPGAPRR